MTNDLSIPVCDEDGNLTHTMHSVPAGFFMVDIIERDVLLNWLSDRAIHCGLHGPYFNMFVWTEFDEEDHAIHGRFRLEWAAFGL